MGDVVSAASSTEDDVEEEIVEEPPQRSHLGRFEETASISFRPTSPIQSGVHHGLKKLVLVLAVFSTNSLDS